MNLWISKFYSIFWILIWFFGIKSCNRTVRIKSRNRTVGIKSRNWTAEITRSGIRAMGHDPTDYARSDGWNYTEWNPRHEPPISRDPTAEITRSEIRVTSHQFRAIRRLKSHGVKSTSWATIHQFCTNLSINRPHLQCKIHLLVGLLLEVGHWDQGC